MKTYKAFSFYWFYYVLPIVGILHIFSEEIAFLLGINASMIATSLLWILILSFPVLNFSKKKFEEKKYAGAIHIEPVSYLKESKTKSKPVLILYYCVAFGGVLALILHFEYPNMIPVSLFLFFLFLFLLMSLMMGVYGMSKVSNMKNGVNQIWVLPEKISIHTIDLKIFDFTFSGVITAFKFGEKLVVGYLEEGQEKKLEFDIRIFSESEIEPLMSRFKK